jgi:chaperonin cofactor prefoldin
MNFDNLEFQELANPTNLVVVAADPVTGQLQEYRMTLPELEQLIEKETPDNRNELND